MRNRSQIRRKGSEYQTDIPLEGEPVWDDENRMLGFYNFSEGQYNWFRIPRGTDSPSYIPKHEIVNGAIRFQQSDGTWGTPINFTPDRVILASTGDSLVWRYNSEPESDNRLLISFAQLFAPAIESIEQNVAAAATYAGAAQQNADLVVQLYDQFQNGSLNLDDGEY